MANCYWVGGNGDWSNSSMWASTSGGSGGTSAVPTNADSVFFNQPGTYTVTGSATALNLLVSAGLVTFNLSISVFGGTGATYFTFNAGTVAAFTATSTTSFSTTTSMTVTTNGVALNVHSNLVTFGRGGFAGTIVLGGALTITGEAVSSTNGKAKLDYGSLDLNNNQLSVDGPFFVNNAAAHTLAFGTNGTGNITVTGVDINGTAFSLTGTITVTGTPVVNISYSGSQATTVLTLAMSEANSISFNFTTGTYALTFLNVAGHTARHVNFSGFAGTWANHLACTIYGDLTLSSAAGFSVTASANIVTLGSTSATARVITSNGKTIDNPITIGSATGGTFQLADAMTLGATRTFTLNNGTLNLNNQLLTTGFFSSNNSNARTIAFSTSGSIRLIGPTGTLWTTATVTNFAYTGTSNVTIDNNTATATTLTPGTLTEAQALNFNIISGSYTLTITNTASFKNMNFVASGTTGFAGTLATHTADITIYGNLTLSSGMTLAAATVGFIFRATSGTQILTSNGKTFDNAMAQNGIGSTLQLADAFAMGATRTFNFNNGTFNGNGQTMTGATALSASAGGVTAFKGLNTSIVFNHTSSTMTLVGPNTTGKISTVSGSIDLNGYTWTATGFGTNVGTKSLTFNGGTLLLTGPYAPTFDNFNPTGFTTVAGTGTGYIQMNAAAAKTFFGNGSTFNCILSNNGAGALTIQNSNTFLGITNGVSPTAFIFTAGTTQTMGSWTVSGTAGNLVTITSTAAGSAANLVTTGGGTVSANYLSLKDSAATPSTLTWYAGVNSTNVSGNSGWIFTAPPSVANGNFFFMF